MRRISLADARARLSELVDAAEHRGARTVICRHGKPAAALVPVDVAMPPRRRKQWTRKQVAEMLQRWTSLGDEQSAVNDLLESRR